MRGSIPVILQDISIAAHFKSTNVLSVVYCHTYTYLSEHIVPHTCTIIADAL